MDDPKIGIVTVLYNSASVLEGFFESLNAQTYKNFVLYAIDNNSTDNGLALLEELAEKSNFKTVIISEKENWGIAKGNNIGILKAFDDDCQYILLANNDIEFAPDTIRTLYDSLIENKCDLIVPKIYYYDTRKIWCAGGGFGYTMPTYHIGQKKNDSPKFNSGMQVEYSPTCFMLIKKEVFDKVGLMDEKYFVYFDDTDFVWRAVKINNFRLYYEPKALVLHKVSTSTKNAVPFFSIYYHHRNSAYFMNKYFPWYRRWSVYAYQTGRYFLRTIKHPNFPSVFKLLGYYKEGLDIYHNSKK